MSGNAVSVRLEGFEPSFPGWGPPPPGTRSTVRRPRTIGTTWTARSRAGVCETGLARAPRAARAKGRLDCDADSPSGSPCDPRRAGAIFRPTPRRPHLRSGPNPPAPCRRRDGGPNPSARDYPVRYKCISEWRRWFAFLGRSGSTLPCRARTAPLASTCTLAVLRNLPGVACPKFVPTQHWLRQKERTTEGAEHTEGDFLLLGQYIFLCAL